MDEQIGEIIKVPMRNGHKLVVYFNTWSDEYPDELCTYIGDENGVILQDIVIVREHENRDSVEVIVYADDNNEDYTHKFEIQEHIFEDDTE